MQRNTNKENNAWHQLTAGEVVRRLGSDQRSGLSSAEVERRARKYPPNRLPEEGRTSPFRLLARQFEDFMVLVLLVAGVVSFLLNETADALVIAAIVFLNAVLGFIQEYRAERSLAALKRLSAPQATVVRDGAVSTVAADMLLPGDILLLEAGDRVPADARLIESFSCEADESILTGESLPVAKDADLVLPGDVAVADRRNMVFMGTSITRGRCRAVVVATGISSEIGRIAEMISGTDVEATPLQRRLDQLGWWLVGACLAVVLLVFLAGVRQGKPFLDMFMVAVSLAVAAIPEGLPATVTIALALGVQRMIKRQAIVRRLPAVETLGCTTVICSDKTGTLTQNKMTVEELWLPRGGAAPQPSDDNHLVFRTKEGRLLDPEKDTDLKLALLVAALCNHADIGGRVRSRSGRSGRKWETRGDPTETALLVAAAEAGFHKHALERRYKLLHEIPFDSSRKRMSVVVQGEMGSLVLVKGAPEAVLDRSTAYQRGSSARTLRRHDRAFIHEVAARMAARGMRLLALAYKPAPAERSSWEEERLEAELVLIGLVGMRDPLRPEAKAAVAAANRAGIRTVMLTGDHANTATAVGRQLGLLLRGQKATAGSELERLDDRALAELLEESSVFARVSPEHKLRIVRALRGQGHVVAMTGDGVNDAPAVKEADIGVAMGITGTDVTKEASSMILMDDNYATIVAAVEEGRAIYDNIRKFIRYLLGCNVGEVLTMFVASLLYLPLPLLPMQILWMNLVTDGLPAIALGLEPPEQDIMRRPPRRPSESIFAHRLGWKILLRGSLIAVCTLGAFTLDLFLGGGPLAHARTLAFCTLVFCQLFFVFQCRSESRTVFEAGLGGNPHLLGAVAVSVAMQLAAVYAVPMQSIFGTVALHSADWVLVVLLGGWSLLLEGLVRAVGRRALGRISVVKV